MSTAQILPVLWRRRWTFLVTFVLVMAAAAAITFTSPKSYSTVAYLIVSQSRPPTGTFEATQANEVLTRTYSELLQTRGIAEAVAAELPDRPPVDEVLGAVGVSAVSQSQLLAISAEGPTPQRARLVANTYADTFVREARELTVASGNTANVEVAQRAALVSEPTRPRPVLYLAVAAVLAALLAAGMALLRQRLDRSLDVDATTTRVFDLPVIGYSPQRSARPDNASARRYDEAFRLAFANLAFANNGTRPPSIAIVSSGEGEGKSTTSLGLARAASELGITVLLVDSDLRRPTLAAEAGRMGVDISASAGLAHHLAGGTIVDFDALAVTVPGTSLSLIPTNATHDAAHLLNSSALEDFVERAEQAYDLVIFDTPPLTLGPDASFVAAVTMGAVFVIDARSTRRTQANRAIDQLRRTRARILGVVLNRTDDLSYSSYYHDGPHPTAIKPSRVQKPDEVNRGAAPARTPGGR